MPLAASRLTANGSVAVPPKPPSFTLGESIDTVGGSSLSVMVPVAVVRLPRVALAGLDKAIVNVSAASSVLSSVVRTVTVLVVSPGEKLNAPPADV